MAVRRRRRDAAETKRTGGWRGADFGTVLGTEAEPEGETKKCTTNMEILQEK